MKKFYTCASVLSADMRNLEKVSKELEMSGVDMLHFDVMDGVFVPNLSFGFPILEAVNNSTDLFLDVHLMITDPLRYIPQTIKAGADLVTFHIESSSDPYETIAAVKKGGAKVGIVIKPGTSYAEVLPFMELVDVVLVMTVEPGFGGQKLMTDCLDKIRELKKIKDEKGYSYEIEIDGGVSLDNIKEVMETGVDVVVAGSAVFGAEDIRKAAEDMLAVIREFD